MASLLDQLSAMTTVVADTGDLEAIRRLTPQEATTNPSLILAAAQLPDYQGLIDATLRQSRQHIGPAAPAEEVISKAIDELSVRFGEEILKVVPRPGCPPRWTPVSVTTRRPPSARPVRSLGGMKQPASAGSGC